MMITIYPSNQNISSVRKLKKPNKKKISNKTKFTDEVKTNSSYTVSRTEEVNNITPMLFLQEVDEYMQELENLDNFAKDAFSLLKELQISLIQNEISEKHLYGLRSSLNKVQDKFFTSKFEELANEIKTRVEVEIAKIEISV